MTGDSRTGWREVETRFAVWTSSRSTLWNHLLPIGYEAALSTPPLSAHVFQQVQAPIAFHRNTKHFLLLHWIIGPSKTVLSNWTVGGFPHHLAHEHL